ncbi:zinc finger protein 1 homolog isoform X2 [Mercenaria mercenaria]|uniref:zinc finger protein 1 homolog isoform X2 n=1 Tax=Mercenaria mercenaria TaxID=6596 RepID=UPI00234EFC52|nr:zinc finger protein 1 homolog isoform X2 [Mercenaria mercenaria]
MESYLMMLYVTLEQESALKNFFVDQGWTFCKPDLSVTTDRLGPSVKDVHTDSAHSENSLRQLGERKTNLKQHLAPVVELATDIPVPASMKNEEQTFSIVQADTEGTEQLKQNEAELQDIGDMKGLSDITCNPDKPKVKVETFEVTLNDDFNDDDDEDTDVDYSYNEADAKSKMKANVSNITEDNAEDEVGITEEDKKAEATQPREPKRCKLSSMEFAVEDQTSSCIKNETNEEPSNLHPLKFSTVRTRDTKEAPLENSVQYSSHEEVKKAFQCKICNYSTVSRGNVYRHQRVHTKSSVKCSKCEKSFAAVYDLRQHFRSIHEGLKLLCEICSKWFNNRYNLRRHFLMEHSKKFKYKCTFCEKQFIEKLCYLGHVNKHLDSRPYKCHICSKSFCYKTSLQRHVETSHQPKVEDFVCETCGAIFKSKGIWKPRKEVSVFVV